MAWGDPRGPKETLFKNILGRYRPGRLTQREAKKELSIRKVRNAIFKASVESRFKTFSADIGREG